MNIIVKKFIKKIRRAKKNGVKNTNPLILKVFPPLFLFFSESIYYIS